MRLIWTDPALDDLEGLRDFIAQDNPGAAGETLRRIMKVTKPLARFPEMGRIGRIAETRELVVSGLPYLVAYRVRDETIEILRVLHAARTWPERL